MSKNKIENLPFTVRIVKSSEDLQKVAELRQKAYARHIPEFAQQLTIPEPADTDPNTFVLLVESKNNEDSRGGVALGTMRVHINRYSPLPLEKSIQLPEHLQNLTLAEAVRFGIADGVDGQQARDALFEAFYLVCNVLKVDKMVICARFPVHKLYLGLHFEDVFPTGEFIKMTHIGNVPHRLFMLQVNQIEQIWYAEKHPLYDFIFSTYHPDLELL
ncbi:MAG: hypothetical protein ABL861_08570 [Nitrosomonas sp.]